MTHDTTVRWTKFLNQGWAAIAHYKGSRNLYDISGNDTTQIGPGAVPISHDHINTSPLRFVSPDSLVPAG